MARSLRAAGFAAGAVLLAVCLASVPSADAASSTARASKAASTALTGAASAAKDPETTSSVPLEDDRCHRTRKRLWVEGEGWVVRRVTTCF